jgi:acetyltransferase-like isoleucine patch superfamily enzyme
MIDTPHLELGEGTKINEQVFVGGMQFPDSKLVVGRNCQIMQMTFINPCRSIVIGDDSGIGGDSLLFGHTSWLSKFEGYPVEFDSIEIGRSVSLAWRVFVLAGTRIGDGAVIGANSLVRGTVPPRCLAVGFPARVVSRAPEFPRDLAEGEREQILREIVQEMASFLEGSGFSCTPDGQVFTVQRASKNGRGRGPVWRFVVEYGPISREGPPAAGGEVHALVSLGRIPAGTRRRLEGAGTLWIDIESKERAALSNDVGEEIVQFLRRYGVRFFRDYGGAGGLHGGIEAPRP